MDRVLRRIGLDGNPMRRTGRYKAYATVAAPKVLAHAVWTAPDGKVHSGPIAVPDGTPAGAAVIVWTDASGAVVEVPPGRDEASTLTIIAGLVTALATIVLAATAHRALHRALDRHRLAAWQAEWSTIGPHWTGHG